jgi:hypothetical protein
MTHDDIFAPLNSLCHLSFIVAHVVTFKLNEVLRDFLNQYNTKGPLLSPITPLQDQKYFHFNGHQTCLA